MLVVSTARDAAMTRSILSDAGIDAEVCESLADLCRKPWEGAGSLLIAEEMLGSPEASELVRIVKEQPPWSDLPLLILGGGAAGPSAPVLALEEVGNVTLLDRPVRVATLVSTVRSALRARLRQYQIREHLAEQERVRRQLREADRRKDEFLAMLAHELRNPLAPVLNAAQILLAKPDRRDVTARQANIIQRQALHLARMLDDLLDVSRITHGKIELRRQRLDLRFAVEQVIESCRSRIEQLNQELTVEVPQEPIWLDADLTRLHQIIGNLVTNANKYTEPGGRLMVRVDTEGGFGRVVVRDTGIGIEPEFLPSIFDLFTQNDRSLVRSEGGLGIGLTMVERLVELHGGTVTAHSDGPHQGSEFVVRLPLAPNPDAIPPLLLRGTASAAPGPRRILVVDDNRDAAETLGELLRLWGHSVTVVHDGPSAIKQAADEVPEVVVLDISMPGMDGYEVARCLRAESRLSGMRLIALTGYGQEEDRRHSRAAGFDAHLVKPVEPEQLRRLLAPPETAGTAGSAG